MRSKACFALLACLCLAFEADAFFNFGLIIRTVAIAANGIGRLIHGNLGGFSAEQLGFESDEDFKARLLGVNALCQLRSREGLEESDDMCDQFGRKYYKNAVGRWGCGKLSHEKEHYTCMFLPSASFVSQGMQVPDVVFRRDEWREAGRSYGRTLCRARNPILNEVEYDEPFVVDDEIAPGYKDSSHFYSSSLVADLEKYASAFEETIGSSESQALPTIPPLLVGIVKALDVAGFRYPIGRRVCQLCKGSCDKLMPRGKVDACKYQACVGFLGGVSAVQDGDKPSCSKIRQR